MPPKRKQSSPLKPIRPGSKNREAKTIINHRCDDTNEEESSMPIVVVVEEKSDEDSDKSNKENQVPSKQL